MMERCWQAASSAPTGETPSGPRQAGRLAESAVMAKRRGEGDGSEAASLLQEVKSRLSWTMANDSAQRLVAVRSRSGRSRW